MLAWQAIDLLRCSCRSCYPQEAKKLHEAYIVTAAKPERPELVRQQLQAAWDILGGGGLNVVTGTHDELCSKLQVGCSVSDQAGLASWMEFFGGQGNALPPCEHSAS